MEDIFISYASEDRERARCLADAFAARGWSVWWDRHIVPGEAFDTRIEQALEAARCVVVLWSRSSAASEWVRNEAAVGAERGVLVPAMIEAVKLPLEFRRKQTADLSDWGGEAGHAGFMSLCQGVGRVLGWAPRPADSAGMAPPAAKGAGGRDPARFVMLVAGLVLAGGLTWWGLSPRLGDAPGSVPRSAQPGQPVPASGVAEQSLAARIAGVYFGDVISDSKGSSQSDVRVTVSVVDGRSVRLSSDYARIPVVEVPLSRAGDFVISASGDTPLTVDLAKGAPQLGYSPHGELSFSGVRR